MAAPFKLLVDLFLRKAAYEVTNSNTNAQTFLTTVLLGDYTTLTAQGGAQIVSVTVNGKTTTLQIPSGSWTQSEMTAAAEYALQLLEAGFTKSATSATARHIDT
jgi:hypothetical protein